MSNQDISNQESVNQAIINKMSIVEKINLCCGADFWHSVHYEEYDIPAMTVSDGPHGIRYQAEESDMLGIHTSSPATCFPTAAATGCSWDRELIGEIGETVAKEAYAYGVDTVLGPGLNIKRNPLCGRNFEYISEDPYLAGQLGTSFVQNVEKTGVSACPKHFAVNNQEYKRFSSDSQLDERTLRELYLSAFEETIKKGKPSMVMSAYNKINGTYCSDNKWLLTEVLRDEWGFDGLVVTDWGGMHDRVKGFASGCDWSMPGGGTKHLQDYAIQAYNQSDLKEEDINRSVNRVLTRALKAREIRDGNAQFGAKLLKCKDMPTAKPSKKSERFDQALHHSIAYKAAVQSAVLLKNDGILPLKTNDIVVVGDMAMNPRYQGAGSSHINPTKLSSIVSAEPSWTYVEGCDKYGDTTEELLKKACEASKNAKACIVVAGLPDSYESEGFDREDMKMPRGHIQMIESIAKVNSNVIVVLLCGCVVEVPWLDKVKAVLYMGLPGQAGGEAAVDLLKGKVNPSGKLAETWGKKYEDVPSSTYFGAPNRDAQYRESLYVGYRYYATADIPVQFPFGYGLSYTTFAYSNLRIEHRTVTVTIKNVGTVFGGEIVELYIKPPKSKDTLHRPNIELKAFDKVWLEPQEEKEISFQLEDRSFALWNEGWKVPEGIYEILVGGSSEDIRLRGNIEVEGDFILAPVWQSTSWYQHLNGKPQKNDLEKLIGHTISEIEPLSRGKFTDENTIVEMAQYSFFVKIVEYFMSKAIAKTYGGKEAYRDPTYKMAMASSADCAIFGLVISSCGAMPKNVAYGLIDIANRHYIKGLLKMIRKK